ncbi:hypothetical protein LZ480_19170 [Solibacillus sp. MA9]|uniref:Uncharacterized protein n=1 Tax=Solibacillus palustris TaxID=2908203 RepID=A0ABS9UI09_9BACL|nr:hypothetical protein [Solibacillus sp. MA9]MCH7323988.1 hypothetical protein [Solibacillus sp. MA9]
MRTSRVGQTTSSIYRNSTRTILSDTHFADAINSGTHEQYRDPREQLQQQKNKQNKPQPRAKKLVPNKARLIVKGMQFNAESAVTLNQLSQFTSRANIINKHNRRIMTYKTSI